MQVADRKTMDFPEWHSRVRPFINEAMNRRTSSRARILSIAGGRSLGRERQGV